MKTAGFFLFILPMLLASAPGYAPNLIAATAVDEEEAAEAARQPKQEAPKQADQDRTRHIYQWIDGKGVVHITDDLSKVPQRYRSGARKLESAPQEEDGAGQPADRGRVSPYDQPGREEREAELKDDWQQRMSAAKRKLAIAERRYRELEKKRDEAVLRWGGPASGRTEGREEAARIEEQMKKVQKDIDDARNDIEVGIPDEARKAGVPPGWLRE